MQLETVPQAARAAVKEWKRQGLSVGLVPTMGYLHEGHASLIRRAVDECDRVVVSVFVNPTQFGPTEDLAAYPRDLHRDAALCQDLGVHLLFTPEPAAMYPSGYATSVEVEGLGDYLCGASRPGHFRGVCTVVAKLFAILLPDKAYFGRKDAQQLAILTRMAADLNLDVTLIPCPIVREADGLAISSRNVYLNAPERRAALVLRTSLLKARESLASGQREAQAIMGLLTECIAAEPLARLDYAHVVDAATLQPVAVIQGPVLVALAVFIGSTRLIDNIVFPEL